MQNVNPHCNQKHVNNALTKYATKISVERGQKHIQKSDLQHIANVQKRQSTQAMKLLHQDTHGPHDILHVRLSNPVSSAFGELGMIEK